jgi:hypothetical protein
MHEHPAWQPGAVDSGVVVVAAPRRRRWSPFPGKGLVWRSLRRSLSAAPIAPDFRRDFLLGFAGRDGRCRGDRRLGRSCKVRCFLCLQAFNPPAVRQSIFHRAGADPCCQPRADADLNPAASCSWLVSASFQASIRPWCARPAGSAGCAGAVGTGIAPQHRRHSALRRLPLASLLPSRSGRRRGAGVRDECRRGYGAFEVHASF